MLKPISPYSHSNSETLITQMAEAVKERCAVVTGANKGIGLEICRQLASKEIVVVLTARDEKKGLEALNKLKESSGISEHVVFHQLDVADHASVSALADFVKTQFGKLDILVNNAGVAGVDIDEDAYRAVTKEVGQINWKELLRNPNYEVAEECLNINYYGTKQIVEAFIPCLQISNSPRIVNVSSAMGTLKNVPNEWAKRVLSDADNLMEERIDEVLHQYLKDYKEGSVESEGWPSVASAYILSKAAVNAYTRILAKKYPTFRINSVCPGFVKTDINYNTGFLSVEEGAESPVRLALLPDDGPSGLFFNRKEESAF